ncbi:F-box domain-containing protein [Mycena chlorophos]|uniref:F-box domain-containing protein n=1 Tax=Mycena chlorophos TaxID=658473 RepID=A0A8H6SIM4_MYCCL|nr:F-box domain-containing protein [Mycena chlorophos]
MSLTALPAELLLLILSELPRNDLLVALLLDRRLNELARRILYCDLVLPGTAPERCVQCFRTLCTQPEDAKFVRRLQIDEFLVLTQPLGGLGQLFRRAMGLMSGLLVLDIVCGHDLVAFLGDLHLPRLSEALLTLHPSTIPFLSRHPALETLMLTQRAADSIIMPPGQHPPNLPALRTISGTDSALETVLGPHGAPALRSLTVRWTASSDGFIDALLRPRRESFRQLIEFVSSVPGYLPELVPCAARHASTAVFLAIQHQCSDLSRIPAAYWENLFSDIDKHIRQFDRLKVLGLGSFSSAYPHTEPATLMPMLRDELFRVIDWGIKCPTLSLCTFATRTQWVRAEASSKDAQADAAALLSGPEHEFCASRMWAPRAVGSPVADLYLPCFAFIVITEPEGRLPQQYADFFKTATIGNSETIAHIRGLPGGQGLELFMEIYRRGQAAALTAVSVALA